MHKTISLEDTNKSGHFLDSSSSVCLDWRLYSHLGDINQSSNTLYILRHGRSEANKQGLIVSDLKNGLEKYGLTEEGITEVRGAFSHLLLSSNLQTEYIIYSSPFLRTIQTASRAAESLSVKEIKCDVRLRERFFGEWELQSDTNYSTVWDEDCLSPCHKKWGVESVYEVLERVTSAIREINSLYKNKHIIFVTHGDAAQIFMCGFSDRNPKGHRHEDFSIKTGNLKLIHEGVKNL